MEAGQVAGSATYEALAPMATSVLDAAGTVAYAGVEASAAVGSATYEALAPMATSVLDAAETAAYAGAEASAAVGSATYEVGMSASGSLQESFDGTLEAAGSMLTSAWTYLTQGLDNEGTPLSEAEPGTSLNASRLCGMPDGTLMADQPIAAGATDEPVQSTVSIAS